MCFIYILTTCPSNITEATVKFGDWLLQKLGIAEGYLQEPEDKHAQNLLPSRFNLNYSFASEVDVKYQSMVCPSIPC